MKFCQWMPIAACMAGAWVAGPAQATGLSLTFDTPTPDLAQTMSTYGFTGGTVAGAQVSGGQLFLNSSGAQTHLDLGAFSGDLRVEYDTTIVGTPGSVNTSFHVGDNDIVFHPGYAGGAFRIDGVFHNMGMGFTPAVSPLSHVALSITAGGLFTIEITNGATFTHVWQDTNYVAGSTVLGLGVGGSGQAVFDNLQVSSVPEPASWALVGAGLLAVAGLARRSSGSVAPAQRA